jgi:uncharacterized protein YggE
MLRRLAPVIFVLGLALAASACKGNTNVNLTNTGEEALASGITVLGVGEVKATPDLAIVSLGVEASAPTVAAARDAGADAASKLIAAVKSNGVADADVQTTNLALNPQYEYANNSSPRVVGYTSVNTVRVTIKDLAVVGATIDAALTAAGDTGRLQGIQFGFADREPLLTEARKQAMDNARSRAEAFAEGAGVKVGDILSITETSTTTPLFSERLAAADFAASTPIEPGESASTVTVTVRYAIAR